MSLNTTENMILNVVCWTIKLEEFLDVNLSILTIGPGIEEVQNK